MEHVIVEDTHFLGNDKLLGLLTLTLVTCLIPNVQLQYLHIVTSTYSVF